MAQYGKLIWSDEFDYEGLPDSKKWSYDINGHGWGNNELQYYTDRREENAFVKDGKLHITAIKESYKGSEYTSARLLSKGKGDWLYGRIEINAKLPAGRGTWPAIWMLPTDCQEWPICGEIDIMEHVGYDSGIIHATIHTGKYNHTIGTDRGGDTEVKTYNSDFHIYAIEWKPYHLDFFVDDKIIFSYSYNEDNGDTGGYMAWPFDQPFHLILNIAVGGNWGGSRGVDDDIFPQTMEVDYVRVYDLELSESL